MEALIIYELKVAAYIAVFYTFYRLLLSKETLHRLNRIVLIFTAVLSFVLPLCIITFNINIEVPQTPVTDISPTTGSINETATASDSGQWLWLALTVIYITGVLICLSKTAISIIGVQRLIRKGEIAYLKEGSRLAVIEKDIAACSWINTIIISSQDYKEGHGYIIAHEQAHIALGHSKDVIAVDILTAFQWFNPMMWMLRSDLRAIHEFEADDAVLSQGANIKEYSYILIKKAISESGYSVTNSFNHSILKNRITMMSKSRTQPGKGLRALYILPLLCISLALTAEEKVNYILTDVDKDSESRAQMNQTCLDSLPRRIQSSPSVDKDSEKITIRQDSATDNKDTVSLETAGNPLIILCKSKDVTIGEDNNIIAVHDGTVLNEEDMSAIDAESLNKIDVYKTEEAVEKYKKQFNYDKPANGVIILVTKD